MSEANTIYEVFMQSHELDKIHSQISEAIKLIENVLDNKKVRFCKKMKARLYEATLKLDDATSVIESDLQLSQATSQQFLTTHQVVHRL